ncbi:MAG: decaprenyl-phosphate phosphoribosyltransferase [Candidatus Methylomirabilis sp.]|nr:decaprenyl-phosphate phosphoribosyltransferase [Deltaproteobacteria bacterium]
MSLASDLVRLARPHQWVKNAFVFTGLLFGHAWGDPRLLSMALLAAAAFCLASSGVYVVNDVLDREADRHHPRKRARPIAAGRVSTTAAVAYALALWAAAFTLGGLSSRAVLMFLCLYVALNIAYSARLKQVVLVDVFIIAAGFMLRILAGTTGLGIEPSRWLLLCGLMVTLFLGLAKRSAEIAEPPDAAISHRKVLGQYSSNLLTGLLNITAAGVILSYALYTMAPRTIETHGTEDLIFTAPVVIYGVFRYLYLLDQENAGVDAASDILRDPHLIGSGVLWAVLTWLLIR